MSADFYDAALSVWACIWNALNSNLSVALIGGIAGAFAGALGAQHIAERSKKRDDIVKEIRNTNAAIMVGFAACNSALALKSQHIKPLYDAFCQERDALDRLKKQSNQSPKTATKEYHFSADLRSFPAPIVSVDTLKDLVFNKISSTGRALALTSVIEQVLHGLRDAIQKRDGIVRRFASGEISVEQLPGFYFGLPLANGDKDQTYPNLIDAIHEYVDDLAFFCSLLCEDLMSHGVVMQEKFKDELGSGAPKITEVDFTKAKKQGLIPPPENYKDWLNAFASRSEQADVQR